MARKKKLAEALTNTPPDDTLRKIISWDPSKNPQPDELRDWLAKLETETVIPYGNDIIAGFERIDLADFVDRVNKDELPKGDYVHVMRRRETLKLLADFLKVLADARAALEGTTAGRIADAFAQGMRVGMMHEKLVSVVDGRYQRKFLAEELGRRAAEKANRIKAAKRPDYHSAVKKLMAEGMKYHPACDEVAKEFDRSKQTVLNHTEDLRPGRDSKNA